MLTPVPFASIIVATYDRADFLQNTVASLRIQTYYGGFEIVVVDNASSEGLREYVVSLERQLGSQVRYVAEPRTGLHHARHAGAKAARGDVLVYVDDDVIARPHWLGALLRPYQDERVDCVGGRIMPSWEVEPPNWLSAFPPSYHSLLDYGDQQRELAWPESIYGCNFSIRKSVLFEVGGFNPDAFGDRRLIWYRGDGETGLVKKVYEAGYRVVYAPYAVVEHRIPAQRLTIAYMRRRAFDNGISAGYINYRYNRPSWPALGANMVRKTLSAIYHRVRQLQAQLAGEPATALKESLLATGSKALALYCARLMMRPGLRRHVLRDSYLE